MQDRFVSRKSRNKLAGSSATQHGGFAGDAGSSRTSMMGVDSPKIASRRRYCEFRRNDTANFDVNRNGTATMMILR